ncbi:ferroxidase FET3 [Ascoidea rubescens DSM 1968]|uniref:Putative iron transport multicopper oxidase n=1 Tax=Ascoidea rubescens DSM 1968 TaxID=1344418 RepID=A0A1D2VRY6_9ASCO|nr:putative iron transport multicopper oxidase precursor [Ascoidea rubescens DSM 1968]ODV64382.1 putative iron transport multicopper oxidase precursor [Ascoidea rubescens DSM 1968]
MLKLFISLLGLFLFFLINLINAAEVKNFYLNATYVNVNLDGKYERQAIGCNDTYPWPTLEANKGDRIQLWLTNGLNDTNTTLHFHGIWQNHTNQMDGGDMISNCPIPPGGTFIYNFTLEQSGLYWYHSHTAGQFADGFRAPFVIHDKNTTSGEDEFPYEYDEEVILTISDWYHQDNVELTKDFLDLYNPTGAEPIPESLLINEGMNLTWKVEPNKTYLVRLVNTGAFVSQIFFIEDHQLEVVEVDGVYVEKNITDHIYVTSAQRYSFLLHTKNSTDKNFAIMQLCDQDMLDVPGNLNTNETSYLIYNEDADLPTEAYIYDWEDFLDDYYLSPLSGSELLEDPDYQIVVEVTMNNLNDGKNYAFFNNLTYVAPKVPTLMTLLSAGELATDAAIYGSNTNTFVLQHNEVIELVLNNADAGKHPFHMHGHHFQLVQRGPDYTDETDPVPYDEENADEFRDVPLSRDTVFVRPNSYIVLRFKADNPGVWIFHCHIEWHMIQGLSLILVEAPLQVQKDEGQQLTENHISICEAAGVLPSGNAAANTEDFFDLTNENVQVKDLPSGFTGRGIVALVFSCIAGILGIIVLGIYGLLPINEKKVIEDFGVESIELDETSSNDVQPNTKSSTSL